MGMLAFSVVQTRTADGLKQKPGWPEERPPGQPDDKLAQPAEPEHPPEGRLSFAVQVGAVTVLAHQSGQCLTPDLLYWSLTSDNSVSEEFSPSHLTVWPQNGTSAQTCHVGTR